MAKYTGRKGLVYISTTGTGAAATVIGLTTWSIDMPTDKIETTAFGDTNKTYVPGMPDCKGAFSGFWDDTEKKIYQASQSSDGCKLYLYPSSTATAGLYLYGPAWVDFSLNCESNGAIKVNANWVANGAWGDKGFSS